MKKYFLRKMQLPKSLIVACEHGCHAHNTLTTTKQSTYPQSNRSSTTLAPQVLANLNIVSPGAVSFHYWPQS